MNWLRKGFGYFTYTIASTTTWSCRTNFRWTFYYWVFI